MKKKSISCSTCIHSRVCEHRVEYMDAIKAIENLRIPVADYVDAYCKDLPWLKIVPPICMNYNVATEERVPHYSGYMGLG